MAGGQFLTHIYASSRSSSLIKSSTPFFFNHIKNYGEASKGKQSSLMEERAPSIAEEFDRVAEEKTKKTDHGVESQTFDKTYDGAEEAVKSNSRVENVKERYKNHEPRSDFNKSGEK